MDFRYTEYFRAKVTYYVIMFYELLDTALFLVLGDLLRILWKILTALLKGWVGDLYE